MDDEDCTISNRTTSILEYKQRMGCLLWLGGVCGGKEGQRGGGGGKVVLATSRYLELPLTPNALKKVHLKPQICKLQVEKHPNSLVY